MSSWFLNLVSTTRNKRVVQDQTARLSSRDRNALVESVQSQLMIGHAHDDAPAARTTTGPEGLEEAYQQVQKELEESQQALHEMQDKEELIAVRLAKYQTAVSRMEDSPKKEEYQQALEKVRISHNQLIKDVGTLKRRIHATRVKKEELWLQLEECHDFLAAADQVKADLQADQQQQYHDDRPDVFIDEGSEAQLGDEEIGFLLATNSDEQMDEDYESPQVESEDDEEEEQHSSVQMVAASSSTCS